MLGHGALGEHPLGGFDLPPDIRKAADKVTVTVQSILIPESGKSDADGRLVKAVSQVWFAIAARLSKDWTEAQAFDWRQWEEIIAGAFHQANYQVVLTPRAGDHERDIIASTSGIGSVRILGLVKAYRPGHLVTAAECRELLGVLSNDRAASKGIVSTTSDFAPRIKDDPFLAPSIPTKLELMNGVKLKEWLTTLVAKD